MITILTPDEQLKYLPMNSVIKKELEEREKDKLRMINKVPFLRVTCLQRLLFEDGTPEDGKQNNLSDIKERFGVTDQDGSIKSEVDGFIFELNSNFDESFGNRQVIGTELSTSRKLYINNPRRVPPPQLQAFTAKVGEEAGFYTTGNLQFTVNSKEQLEFLTPFLLHPGNTVVFEFGYADKTTTMNGDLFSNGDVEEFLTDIVYKKKDDVSSVTVGSLGDGEDVNGFFKKRQQRVFESNGNYEYLVGVINNFDFKLNQDFGFDVTIDVWSITKTILSSPAGGNITVKSSNTITANQEAILKNREKNLRSWIDRVESKRIDTIIKPAQSLPAPQIRDESGGDRGREQNSPSPLIPLNTDDRDSVITMDTSRGRVKYIRFGKILEYLGRFDTELKYETSRVSINPYLVSSDNSCILFRKRFPTLANVKLNEENGYVEYKKDDINFISPQTTIIPLSEIDFKVGVSQEEIDNIIEEGRLQANSEFSSRRSLGVASLSAGLLGRSIFQTGAALIRYQLTRREAVLESREAREVRANVLKVYKPFIFDVTETEGDIKNIYYDTELFIGHYKNYNGKTNDVLKQIISDINYATNNIWDLKLLESFDLTDNETPQKETVECFSCRKIDNFDRNQTYTFKFNQQESIVTELSFDLGLEGLIADQIYFESINQTDNSEEGVKLNLLLFEKHEKGIRLEDKRNKKIESLYTENPELKGSIKQTSDIPQEATGSFNTLYNQDPTSYLLSVGVKDEFSFKSSLLDLANDPTNSEKSYEEIINLADGTLIPLIEPNYEVYRKAMKDDKYIQSNNDGGQSDEDEDKQKLGGVNPLLQSNLSITLPGIGGIQPLQFFNTDGLPDVYDKRGDFCIMSLTQTITPSEWTTSITAAFRVREEDE